LKLAPHERRELNKMAASRTMKAGEVRRAKVTLRLAAGQSYRSIMKQEGCGQDFVARWKERKAPKFLLRLTPVPDSLV
jgi:transposase